MKRASSMSVLNHTPPNNRPDTRNKVKQAFLNAVFDFYKLSCNFVVVCCRRTVARAPTWRRCGVITWPQAPNTCHIDSAPVRINRVCRLRAPVSCCYNWGRCLLPATWRQRIWCTSRCIASCSSHSHSLSCSRRFTVNLCVCFRFSSLEDATSAVRSFRILSILTRCTCYLFHC